MTELEEHYERVPFRLYSCPECRFLMCWVNPRKPTYCPECGKMIFHTLKERVMMADDEAVLMTHGQNMAGGIYVEGFNS